MNRADNEKTVGNYNQQTMPAKETSRNKMKGNRCQKYIKKM